MVIKTLVAMAVVIGLSGSALGQPGGEFPDNPGGPAQIREADQQRKTVALDLWRSAMEKLDYPVLMFAFGIRDGSPERSVGFGLSRDELAFTEALATEVRAAISGATPSVDIVDVAAMEASKIRAAASVAAAGGSQDLIDALMDAEDTDYAVVFEFVPLSADTYRVLGKIVNGRRAVRLDTGAYEVAVIDHNFLKRVGSAMFEEIARKMADIATVRFSNIKVQIAGGASMDRKMRDLGDAIELLEYVHDDSVRFRFRHGLYTSMVRYDGGALELAVDLQDLLANEFRMRAQVALADGGIILTTYGKLNAPNWRILTDPDVDDPEGLRAAFRELYEESGRPQVAILFNEFESVQLESTQTTNPDIEPRLETRLSYRPSELVASFETELEAVLMDAGVRVRGGAELRDGLRRRLLLDQGRPDDGLVAEAEIEEALRQLSDVDVYVLGHFYPNSSGGGVAESRMIFKAFTRQTKSMLGTGIWPSKEATQDPEWGVDPDNETDIARFVGGSIIDAYYRNHLKAGNSIEVVVDGVASIRQIQLMADSFEMAVPGVISAPNPTFNSGVGRFTVKYEGSYSDLVRGVNEALASLMIDTIVDQASQEVLRVRARPFKETP